MSLRDTDTASAAPTQALTSAPHGAPLADKHSRVSSKRPIETRKRRHSLLAIGIRQPLEHSEPDEKRRPSPASPVRRPTASLATAPASEHGLLSRPKPLPRRSSQRTDPVCSCTPPV